MHTYRHACMLTPAALDGSTPSGLTIRAANPGQAVLDAQGVSGRRGVYITGGVVTIEDVEITGGNTVRSLSPCPATPHSNIHPPRWSLTSLSDSNLLHIDTDWRAECTCSPSELSLKLPPTRQ